MFYEKILSKFFLVSNIIFCYWYENFVSNIFFSLIKCFFGINVMTFSLKHFFPS